MTRLPPILTRALPLAAALALTTTAAEAAGPGNPSVFYCDQKSMADRQAEIFTIRQDILPSLKAVIDDPDGGDDRVQATEEHAEYSARLKELLLGVNSCKELRDFERYGEAGPPKKDDDDLLAPPMPPKKGKGKKPPKAPPKSSQAEASDPAVVQDYITASGEVMDAEVARMKAAGATQEAIDSYVQSQFEATMAEAARMRAELEGSSSADGPPSSEADSQAVADYVDARGKAMDAEVARMKAAGATQASIDTFVQAHFEATTVEAVRMQAGPGSGRR